MNIAIYQPRVSYYLGGGEVIPLEHARVFSMRGHNVTIVTVRAPYIKQSNLFKEFIRKNRRVHIFYIDLPKEYATIYKAPPGIDWNRWIAESVYVGQRAWSYFSKNTFDVVAVHNAYDMIGVPFEQRSVLHLHGYPSAGEPVHRALFSGADEIVAVSKKIKEEWECLVPGMKMRVVENGIDSSIAAKSITFPSKKIDVLYIGRLIPVKGISYLLHAIREVKKICPGVRVIIAGDGPQKKELENLSRRLGVSKHIRFFGKVSEKTKDALFAGSAMLVAPSIGKEGVLTTMLEAATYGVPTITTTSGSMKEFLKHSKNGLLVSPGNTQELSVSIVHLLKNKDEAERLGKNAKKDAREKWSWEKKIAALEKIYERKRIYC
jgi:glycosyltransferase involved in cell wall biosynthesis